MGSQTIERSQNHPKYAAVLKKTVSCTPNSKHTLTEPCNKFVLNVCHRGVEGNGISWDS